MKQLKLGRKGLSKYETENFTAILEHQKTKNILSHHIEDISNALTHHFIVLGIVSILFINFFFVFLFVYDQYFDGGNVFLTTIAEFNGRTYARNHPFNDNVHRFKTIYKEIKILFDDWQSGERSARLL